MTFGNLIFEIAAALDDAAAIGDDHGYDVRGQASLALRVRFDRGSGFRIAPEPARKTGSIARNASRLTIKR